YELDRLTLTVYISSRRTLVARRCFSTKNGGIWRFSANVSKPPSFVSCGKKRTTNCVGCSGTGDMRYRLVRPSFVRCKEVLRTEGLPPVTNRSRIVFVYSRAFNRRGRKGPGFGCPAIVSAAKTRSIQASICSRSALVGCG